jgi:hypothetical protein
MTKEEYQTRFNNLLADLNGSALGDALVATTNEAQLYIKTRIQETGINSEGQPYEAYTKQYKRFKNAEVKHRPGTKNKNNSSKYKGFTDFSFTNRMWMNTKVVSDVSEASSEIGKATISQTTDFDRNKMEWNTERFGDIMKLSKDEEKNVKQSYNERIAEIFTRNGLELR